MNTPDGSPICILGAGALGTALATILAQAGRPVRLWSRSPDMFPISSGDYPAQFEGLQFCQELHQAVTDSPLVIFAVPSQSLRDIARKAGEYLKADQLVIHGAKGFELGTLYRMSEVLIQETCARKIGVLSGPNLAPEVIQGLPAGTLVASRFDEVLNAAQSAFEGTNMHVFCGRDVIGAEVAGAFKNVIAIAAGAADGLDIGESAKALLITRAFNEMTQLGQCLGADILTFHGIAGLGDLAATCASRFSRNRSLGERLARGEPLDAILASSRSTFEGISCTQTSQELAAKHNLRLTVVDMVATILRTQSNLRAEMDKLLAKPKPAKP